MAATYYEGPVRLVTRSQWGALPQQAPVPALSAPVDKVFFSAENDFDICTNPEECMRSVQKIQQFYMDKGHVDIPYNFVVGSDGLVYEGRGWGGRPATDVLKREEFRDRTIDIGVISGIKEITPSNCDYVREAFKFANQFVELGIQDNYISKDYVFEGFSDEVKGPEEPRTLDEWTDNETDDGLVPTGFEEVTYNPIDPELL